MIKDTGGRQDRGDTMTNNKGHRGTPGQRGHQCNEREIKFTAKRRTKRAIWQKKPSMKFISRDLNQGLRKLLNRLTQCFCRKGGATVLVLQLFPVHTLYISIKQCRCTFMQPRWHGEKPGYFTACFPATDVFLRLLPPRWPSG